MILLPTAPQLSTYTVKINRIIYVPASNQVVIHFNNLSPSDGIMIASADDLITNLWTTWLYWGNLNYASDKTAIFVVGNSMETSAHITQMGTGIQYSALQTMGLSPPYNFNLWYTSVNMETPVASA